MGPWRTEAKGSRAHIHNRSQPRLDPLIGLQVDVKMNGQFTALNGSLLSNNQGETSFSYILKIALQSDIL